MTPLPLEPLLRLPKILGLSPSHSGDKLAFYWDKTGRFEICLYDLNTRRQTQLTDGNAPKGPRSGLVWTRDEQALIFAKDQDGNEKNDLWLLELDSGELRQLSSDPAVQDNPVEVSPDGRFLSVLSTRGGQRNLFTLELGSQKWRQLTQFENPVYGGRWSPDGTRISFSCNASDDLNNEDGYLLEVATGEVKRVLHVRDGSQDGVAAWHPNGRLLAVRSDAGGHERSGILELGSEPRWLGEEGVEETPLEFSPDGRWLLSAQNAEASRSLRLYEVETGQARALNLPAGVVWDAHFALDGAALVLKQASATSPGDLLLYHLEADRAEVLIPTDFSELDSSRFVADEVVRYPSADGQSVPALLYQPPDIPEGVKLPALLEVHGGPTWQFFRDFDPFVQYLVSSGYVVLRPNIRGSTGYGVSWRDANLKDWGGGDLEDVAAGARYLASLPFVDATRIGVMGGSFGGFMSYLAVVKKPELFKVGAPIVGITDLHLLYEEDPEDLKYYFRQQMGDPERDRSLWRDRSAVDFAQDLRAKLLMLHGLNDPRCPVSQARVFRDRLLELGKREGQDFEYHEFADEGHGSSGDIAGMLRMYGLISDFLERRL